MLEKNDFVAIGGFGAGAVFALGTIGLYLVSTMSGNQAPEISDLEAVAGLAYVIGAGFSGSYATRRIMDAWPQKQSL